MRPSSHTFSACDKMPEVLAVSESTYAEGVSVSNNVPTLLESSSGAKLSTTSARLCELRAMRGDDNGSASNFVS